MTEKSDDRNRKDSNFYFRNKFSGLPKLGPLTKDRYPEINGRV